MYAPVYAQQPSPVRTMKIGFFDKPALLAVVAITLVVAVGSVLFVRSQAAVPSAPDHIVAAVDFPLYMPASLPEGYNIDESSFSAEGGAVLFTISSSNGQKIIVSEQARPKGVDISKFHKEQIKEGTPISLDEGEAVIGQLGSNLAASVVTEKTWIIISDPTKKQTEAIKQLPKSLTIANQ
jgi:hypothetical protein